MPIEYGHIQLHRKILNWRWYKKGPTKDLFVHLLLTANYKDTEWEGVTIRRGQRIASREALVKELSLTQQQIKTAIKNLKSTNEITTESTSKYTIFTIVKYDDYQPSPDLPNNESTNSATNEQPTSNQRATSQQPQCNKEKKDNKEKKKKNILPGAETSPDQLEGKKPIVLLPLNDKTEYPVYEEQCQEWAGLYPAVDVIQQFREMRGWLIGNPRKRKTRNGVDKFINGWLAREQDKGGSVGNGYSGGAVGGNQPPSKPKREIGRRF